MSIEFDVKKPAFRRITEHLRRLIHSGRLTPGTKLPSCEEMMELWNVRAPTIQAALTPLVKENLLDRRPRHGTFVRKREERLTRVGIYARGDIWRNPASAFGRCLCDELHRQLGGDEISEEVWVDPRPTAEQKKPWDELVRAASERRFQVLIVPVSDLESISWLNKLAVPVVFLCSLPIGNRVCTSSQQWPELAMQLLADQGCRRVGAICSIMLPTHEPDYGVSANTQFYQTMEKAALRLGLDLRPEWIIRAPHYFPNSAVELPQFGLESLRTLWSQSERPDGIAVFEDVTANGVMMGIMGERIRVPEELKLVLNRNAEVGLFCPVPASFIDLHASEVAAALISQARKLYNGEEVTAVKVQYHPVSLNK